MPHEVSRELTVYSAKVLAHAMENRKSFKIFCAGSSLRTKIAYRHGNREVDFSSPSIVLGCYYLYVMGRIVERIVNVDAPAAKLAAQASIEMLEGRRAARNYALFQDRISSYEPEFAREREATPARIGDLSQTRNHFRTVWRRSPYTRSDSLRVSTMAGQGKNPSNAFR